MCCKPFRPLLAHVSLTRIDHSFPTHVPCPTRLFLRSPLSTDHYLWLRVTQSRLGLRSPLAGSPSTVPPYRVRHPTDWPFTSVAPHAGIAPTQSLWLPGMNFSRRRTLTALVTPLAGARARLSPAATYAQGLGVGAPGQRSVVGIAAAGDSRAPPNGRLFLRRGQPASGLALLPDWPLEPAVLDRLVPLDFAALDDPVLSPGFAHLERHLQAPDVPVILPIHLQHVASAAPLNSD